MTLPTDALAVPEAPISHDLSAPLVATEDLITGQVIFFESALVASTGGAIVEGEHEDECHDEECQGCLEIADLDVDEQGHVSPIVLGEYDALMEYCNSTDPLVAVDIRKHLFKCFHMYELDPSSLDQLLSLDSLFGTEMYLDAAVGLRDVHPAVIPSGLSDDDVAHLIGVIHKCSIPLDEIDGTGLFLYVSQLQHSCIPNACFTDSEDALWVTAIRPIAAGEVVTVDFFNLHYQPTSDRRETLRGAHYTCTCVLCQDVVPDKTRAFKCTSCHGGIVHPTGDTKFACVTCHATWGNDLIDAAVADEVRLLNELEVFSGAELEGVMAASSLHRFHHIFYATYSNLMQEHIDETMTPEEALVAYEGLLTSLNYVVEYPHAQKIQFLNIMAQTCIGLGNISQATSLYERAYALSCQVFGATCGETQLFLQLVEETPTSVEAMAAIYGFDEDDDEYDDDDDMTEDEEVPEGDDD
ncbi:Aste57867_12078 [Aphanomyces stellatus]|uniref:Aste57867_12078 protein n=1 Tax=Aphanomyces stellatus TaxID=120398 RepID=A0A485KVE9_9STRA|nr:hypothetical protein As57867_012033 [Aphanomyces stellatus]VFT88933.1 Aste57867_12078 [Aphanomyces stellatus]